jgi:hypothetical protein
VRLLAQILLAIWFSGNLLGAFAQQNTNTIVPISGYAIVTPTSGNLAGLIATEALRNRTSPDLDQAVVGPSPLITSASILVAVGPISENATGIAITNPSSGTGGINLILTDPAGGVVLNTTVFLGPRDHFAKFINELFQTQPVQFDTPLLLTISSEIPVAILVINFRNGRITSVPLSSLSSPTPVPVQSLITTTTIQPVTIIPVQQTFTLPVPQVFTPTNPVMPVTPSIPAVPANPATPTNPTIPTIGTVPTFPSFPTAVFSTTSPSTLIGGNGSLVFAQVAGGTDWATDFTIGNTSAGAQIVRIDFFDSTGLNTGSLTNIVIQPSGVATFSSDGVGGVVQ